MSEVKRAQVEVTGLPYRVRSVADEEEAKEAFAKALNRYLFNHAEDDRFTQRYFRGYKIIHTNSIFWISQDDRDELAQLTGDPEDATGARIPMRCALNHIAEQKRTIERLTQQIAQREKEGR